MVEIVVSMELPVDEKLTIRKNRVMPVHPTGEEKRITFHLSCAQLGYYNEAMRFGVEPGVLDVMVGVSSSELPLSARVRLSGNAVETMGRRVYECPVTME